MENKILEILKEKGMMRPGDIATAIGEDKDAVAKIIKKLVSEGKVVSPQRCFYSANQ